VPSPLDVLEGIARPKPAGSGKTARHAGRLHRNGR
jgi:hypothetical protein